MTLGTLTSDGSALLSARCPARPPSALGRSELAFPGRRGPAGQARVSRNPSGYRPGARPSVPQGDVHISPARTEQKWGDRAEVGSRGGRGDRAEAEVRVEGCRGARGADAGHSLAGGATRDSPAIWALLSRLLAASASAARSGPRGARRASGREGERRTRRSGPGTAPRPWSPRPCRPRVLNPGNTGETGAGAQGTGGPRELALPPRGAPGGNRAGSAGRARPALGRAEQRPRGRRGARRRQVRAAETAFLQRGQHLPWAPLCQRVGPADPEALESGLVAPGFSRSRRVSPPSCCPVLRTHPLTPLPGRKSGDQ